MMETVDIKRRFFVFGAAATLVIPKPKSFFIMSLPKLIRATAIPDGIWFKIPEPHASELLEKLRQGVYDVSSIPEWIIGKGERTS